MRDLRYQDIILIYSGATGEIYLDEDYVAHAFLADADDRIKDFCEKNQKANIYPGKPTRFLTDQKIATICYATGAESIEFHAPLSGTLGNLERCADRKHFYNHDFCKNAVLYKETKKQEYIRALANTKFIVPARVKNSDACASASYGIGFMSKEEREKDQYIYLGFSDLPQYEQYAKNHPEFQPLLISVEEACRIGKKHGYLINAGFKSIFTIKQEQLQEIEQEIGKE
ncbi:MAG: hypothetical protein Q4B26_00265 [Eubacteriales bacterium]|nr:hypothetical protein [Eubacteriales bacterium]